MLTVYEELGDASRRLILSELWHGPKNVTEIVKATNLKQPNVSNHLARMKERGVVRASRVGRQVFYGLASPEVESIVSSVFRTGVRPNANLRLEDLAKSYAKAAVRGDEAACGDILEAIFRAQLPMLEIYQELITPAMHLVGKWYQVEAVDEGQEHLASNITERMMTKVAALISPVNIHSGVAVLGCAEGSYHTIGLRMISDVMRTQGWKCFFLGASCPSSSFLNAVEQHRPELVLCSCSTSESRKPTCELIQALCTARSRKQGFRIGIGGCMVVQDSKPFIEAGADFTSQSLRQFATDQLPGLQQVLLAG